MLSCLLFEENEGSCSRKGRMHEDITWFREREGSDFLRLESSVSSQYCSLKRTENIAKYPVQISTACFPLWGSRNYWIFLLGLWEGKGIRKLCQTRNLRKLKYISLISSDLKRQFCEVLLTGSVTAGTSIRIMTPITANML